MIETRSRGKFFIALCLFVVIAAVARLADIKLFGLPKSREESNKKGFDGEHTLESVRDEHVVN